MLVDPERRRAERGALWALAALLLGVALGALGGSPPRARDLDADPALNSGGRAWAVLERILGDEAPHPVGTPAHAEVVERILSELRAIGLEPRVEDALVVGHNGVVTRVRNLVARVPGRAGTGTAIALVSHHDSVAAGPGAADDGAGVAASIEVVRALAHGAPLEHDLVLLVTDGEEVDLSGAVAFVRASPAARGVRAVVNLEARGTEGPVHLFQTGPGIEAVASASIAGAARASTSSIAALVYDRLPNDTDFSVFLGAGWTGVNLAFIRGVRRYHTPLDDLAHLAPRSLQHLGDAALCAVRALDALDLARPHAERGERVWHDWARLTTISWPSGWSAPLAAAALLLLVLAARRARASIGALAACALATGLAIAFASLLAWAFAAAQAPFHAARDPWFAAPTAWGAASHLTGLVGTLCAWRFPAARRAGLAASASGTWILLAALGLALAVVEPRASPLLVVPALAAGLLVCAPGLASTRRATSVVILAFLASAGIAFPFRSGVEDALGWSLPLATGALSGLAIAPLGPLLRAASGRLLAAVVLLAGVVFVGLARLPDRTPDRPAWTNVVHVQTADDARFAVQTFGLPLPSELAGSPVEVGRLVPWSGLAPAGFLVPAPRHAEPAPSVVVEDVRAGAAPRRLRLGITSTRGASVFVLELPAGLRATAVRSGALALLGDVPRGPRLVFAGIGPEGLEVELEVEPEVEPEFDRLESDAGVASPRSARLADLVPGLPRGIAAPFAPDPLRVPRGRGHASVVAIELEL